MNAPPLPFPSPTGRAGLDGIRQVHDRTRLFCSVLDILADDLFQSGRESMALSLSSFAADELAPLLDWEEAELAHVLITLASTDGTAQHLHDAFISHHATIVAMLPRVMDGVEAISQCRLPERPLDFILGVLRFTETVKNHIDWQDYVVLPFALATLPEASATRLEATLAVHRRHCASNVTRLREGTQ